MYSLRLRSCRLMGVFVISPLPPFLIKTACAAGPLRSVGITPLHRYCGPGRRRLVFHRFPGFAGYTMYLAPPVSRWDERVPMPKNRIEALTALGRFAFRDKSLMLQT